MRTKARILAAAATFAVAAPLLAETISYSYDARGRLVKVIRGGAATTDYTFDKADNIVAKVVNGGSAPPPPPPPSPSFSIANAAAVNEGTTAVFTVTKSGNASSSLSVNYATSNGTAVSPSDYTAQSGTLTFLASETSKTISVPTVADNVAEPSEQFSVTLSSPSSGATVGTATGTGTINASGSGGGGANQPPVTTEDSAGTSRCRSVSVNVVQNDTDPDGNYPLSLVSVGTSSKGTAVVESSTNIRFTPSTSGTATLSYTVQDSLGATATGTLSISILSICPVM